jgi:hypothetical protein
MADEAWREAERRWAASPDDQELVAAAIAVRRRAGLPVPGRILERERFPARTFESTLELTVHAALPDGTVRQVGTTPSKKPLKVPEHQAWWLTAMYGGDFHALQAAALAAGASGLVVSPSFMDRVTDDDLEGFDRDAPPLRVLGLPGSWLTRKGLARVAKLDRLQRLGLDSARRDVGKELEPLHPGLVELDAPAVDWLPGSLRRLDLNRSLIGPGVERLARLTELVHLDLQGCTVPSDALLALAPLRQLRSLGLHGTAVDDAALEGLLPHLPDLEALDLERCDGVTDRGVRAIVEHARGLRVLNLDHARSTTPDGLLALRALTKLEQLHLRGGKRLVAAQAPTRKALREALPGCKILPAA